MARDSEYIVRTVRAQEKLRAALMQLYPDRDVPALMIQNRRGFPYVQANNMESLADFLAGLAVEGVDSILTTGDLYAQTSEVDPDSLETKDIGAMNRNELLELAERRGIKVSGTGMSGYISRDNLLSALGWEDDGGRTGVD